MSSSRIALGVGFYSRAEAARLLRVHPDTLRRWVNGYSYRDKTGLRHDGDALVPPSIPTVKGLVALSFVDLIELRVVKALIDRNYSLQAIRKARDIARQHIPVEHPFASRRVYTPRQGRPTSILIRALDDANSDFVELTPKKHLQLQAGDLVETFLEEVEFDQCTSLAHRWWPLGPAFPVMLDPSISFGAPVVAGTGVRTVVVAAMAGVTSTVEAAAAYTIDRKSAEAAVEFEARLRAA